MTTAFPGPGHRLGSSSPIYNCFSSLKSCGQGLLARVKAVWDRMDRTQKSLLGLAALSLTVLLLTKSISIGALAVALLMTIFLSSAFQFAHRAMV